MVTWFGFGDSLSRDQHQRSSPFGGFASFVPDLMNTRLVSSRSRAKHLLHLSCSQNLLWASGSALPVA